MSKSRKRKRTSKQELPAIPDKHYFTISEVSYLCAVKAYVLRYWEQEFPQLKPIKRRGNRRYYQNQDVMLIRKIKKLLYDDGFTIEGARTQLTNTASRAIVRDGATQPPNQPIKFDSTVKKIIADLETVLHNLRSGL